MTVTAGHSGRPRSQPGGPAQSPPHYIVLLSLRPPPPPHPVWWRAALKPPVGHPSPHAAAPYRSVNPPQLAPHCSVLCLCRADPSLCRLNLHTKAQCKSRQLCGSIAEFTLNPHRLYTAPCALQLHDVAHSHGRCMLHFGQHTLLRP